MPKTTSICTAVLTDLGVCVTDRWTDTEPSFMYKWDQLSTPEVGRDIVYDSTERTQIRIDKEVNRVSQLGLGMGKRHASA